MDYFFSFAFALSFLHIFTLASSTPILNWSTDEYALLTFKKSITSDPYSLLSHNWSVNISICNWIGVSCGTKHRRVTALNVSDFQLGGTIAPHIGNLTFLQSLDISSNNFTGLIPPEISKLRRLKELNMGVNSLISEIPSWLGNLSQLEHLYLNNNAFSGTIPPSLFNISKLKTIDLGNNFLEGILPQEIAKLSYLEILSVASNNITGSIPNVIFNMSSLIEINMKYNRLSGELSNDICSNAAPKLKNIYLSENQLYGKIPANIYKCRELEDLRLPINKFSGDIPREIGSLPLLRILSLFSNNFKGGIPNEIKNLTSLEILVLSDNNLEGKIPSSIFNISSLKHMNLSKNGLSGSIQAGALHNMLDLQILDLSDNILTGDVPNEIGYLTSLKYLYLYYNNLGGALPQELGNLVHLEFLYVEGNYLSGSIPSSIFNLSALKELNLMSNQFFGTIPSNIGNSFSLYSLQLLSLGNNKLSGEIPSFITSNATKLTMLDLRNNSLGGDMPNFGNLRLLQELYIWGNQLTGAKSPAHELGFFSSFTNCPYLETLEIAENPLNGILPSSIGNLSTSLYKVNAHQCNIKGVLPSEIGNLSSLIYLSLSGNQITGSIPTGIGNLKKLQGLYISDNHLQGDITSDLCKMSNLETLALRLNMLTGPIPNCIGNVKSLRRVYLASNKLESTIPSNLWNLRDILFLDLSSNYLTGQLSSQIGNLKQINSLDLSYNQLSGDIPTVIDGCESLEILSLSNNNLQGSIPESLGNVRGLTTLDLSNNSLSGFIPKSLEDLRFLQYFNVSFNKLEGEIPNGINISTAQSFVHNSALCGAPKFLVPPCLINQEKSRSRTIALMVFKYVLPPFVATTIVVVIVLMFIRRRKQVIIPPFADILLGNFVRRIISYIEIVRGTNSFSEANLLGVGSFGSVYKATLSDGLNIAVKVFNLELEGAIESFDTESEILSSIRHRNLLPVIGCCTNLEFRALILKYMPSGSLEKWLHSESYFLDLVQRVKITIDVALGLEYLHHGHTFPVIHCDIKPSNVLLDEDMTAHVGDFGISKLFDEGEVMTHTTTLATIGYAAPEYGSEGKISTNGDVYSYGILVLEMFTEKKPTHDMFNSEMSLKDWVNQALLDNAISEIVVPSLVSTEDEHECVSSILDMAMKCLAFSPYERIDMIQVGAQLHNIKAKVTAAAKIHRRHNRE